MQAAEYQIATWSVELEGITRALDAAFQLLADPQTLFDAFPDGFKLLLVQACLRNSGSTMSRSWAASSLRHLRSCSRWKRVSPGWASRLRQPLPVGQQSKPIPQRTTGGAPRPCSRMSIAYGCHGYRLNARMAHS
jgi:hypothetical protein